MPTIANDSRTIAILDIPVNNYHGEKYHLLYQTVHLKTIVGGHAYRTPQEIVDLREEIIANLVTKQDISSLTQTTSKAMQELSRQFRQPLMRRSGNLSIGIIQSPSFQLHKVRKSLITV